MDEINALSSFDGVKMPFSLEAEQAVLGSLLIDPGCISTCGMQPGSIRLCWALS